MRGVPWWGVISAAAAPVLLIGGWTVAAGLQPRFDPVSDTISALAAITGGGQVGLAERVTGAAQAAWPLAVVLSARAAAPARAPVTA